MILASEAVPPDWVKFVGCGHLGIGFDVATTEKKTSNPSSLTVSETLGSMEFQRLVVRWKSEDPDVAETIIRSVLEAAPRNQLRGLAIDASSERLNAQTFRKKFRSFCPVHLIVNSEAIDWEGQRYNYKTLLGDLYCSAFEDGCIALPPGAFIISDHRLVKKNAGSYTTEVDEIGGHGDTFDSGKLARWIHVRKGGPVRASAAAVGSFGTKPKRPGLIGPIGRSAGNTRRKMNS